MSTRFWIGAVAVTALLAGPVACDGDSSDGGAGTVDAGGGGGDTGGGADTGGGTGDTGGGTGDTGGGTGDTGGGTGDTGGGTGDTGGGTGDTGGGTGDTTMTDGGGLDDTAGTPSELDGTWLLSISTIIAPDLPIQFIAVTDYTANADPTSGGTIHFTLQPLQTAPGMATREPVGDVIEADGTVDGAGNIVLDVGTQTVVGAANPVSGSDIEATLKLIGTVKSADLACGTIEGTVTQPFEAPLTGSTWAAISIEDTTAANLPEPVGACPTEGGGDDAGGTDTGAPDAGGEDTGGGQEVTWDEVWGIIDAYGCTGCHSGGSGGLFMPDQETAYANLVGVESTTCPGETRVIAGNGDDSLVYKKVMPDIEVCGPKMPFGGTGIDPEDAAIIHAWIQAGAQP